MMEKPSDSSFLVSGSRLMERPAVDSKRSKATPFWGVNRGGEAGVDIGQTEYITRLTALRDSLIDQEQSYLAQALDRLRIHSLSHKSSSYRLRMNGDDASKSTSSSGIAQTPRTNMVTTVEKFRQMRPKRHPPVIFPLQGRQLLESHPAKEKDNSTGQPKGGNTSIRTTKDGEASARSLPSKVDETVQANLQRLLQPTSSIPNIGRKALKKQQSFEPKTRALSYAHSNNVSNNSNNRFITRPRVNIPKRSPPLASPDTIIEAVTNSNNIYSMNFYRSGYCASKGSVNGYDETCSESDSVHDAEGGLFNKKFRNGPGSSFNPRLSYERDSSFSGAFNNTNNHSNGESGFYHLQSTLESQDSELMQNPDSTSEYILGKPGAYSVSNDTEGDGSANKVTSQKEIVVVDTASREFSNNNKNNGITPMPAGRKLYRNSGPLYQNHGISKPHWQRTTNNDGSKHRHFLSNYSSVSTSRSDSQVGSTVVSSGQNTNKEVARNSIDIFLPSHPFGIPFVRTESNLSRGDTGEGWIHINNPSVEPIQPGTRFPAINGSQNEVEGTQSQPRTRDDRRSRSNSRGESSMSRQQKTSSLPNVRARHSNRRRSSSSDGVPDESSNGVRPWYRTSFSQGGDRGATSSGDEGGSCSQKRHIVVDMPSIIFNAASPEVGEASNANVGDEVNQSQTQDSAPQSRAGQNSSAATPTGWSAPSVPNLSKAVKQQEIRKRELHNLLEDVRELNIRTEVLSSQSATND
ncbi:hypothetical protein PoB_003948600 [Plakobranchus ocellatus]|uniref:Uncharacterized protein n=1 Tax=Plakobranchus ocellatus TaxID=259542 RepID=A0AAV4AXM0_9GAST|nr:hypothetical protein PoB_003948600 [Plakobranchus ocellatus]